MTEIKVYVDTNILKYAASSLKRFRPRQQTLNWGGKEIDTTVHDIVEVNPNNNIRNNPQLRYEVELIKDFVALEKQKNLMFCLNIETELESWGLPNMDSQTGKLYGAKVHSIEAPFKYSRVVVGWNTEPKEEQFSFIKNIQDKRFSLIQKAVGAYQGKDKWNRNQLLDAFHLWCAEHNHCHYFLTCEAKKLRKQMSNKRDFSYIPKVVSPSELLKAVDNNFLRKVRRAILKKKIDKEFS